MYYNRQQSRSIHGDFTANGSLFYKMDIGNESPKWLFKNWMRLFVDFIATLDSLQLYNFMKFMYGNWARISKSILCCYNCCAVTVRGSMQEIWGAIERCEQTILLAWMFFSQNLTYLISITLITFFHFHSDFIISPFIFKLINFKSTYAVGSSMFAKVFQTQNRHVLQKTQLYSRQESCKTSLLLAPALQPNTNQNDTGR